MAISPQDIAYELGELTPYHLVAGKDYVEVQAPDGTPVDNIVVKGDHVSWGANNEYMLYEDKPEYMARAIASTLKDVG